MNGIFHFTMTLRANLKAVSLMATSEGYIHRAWISSVSRSLLYSSVQTSPTGLGDMNMMCAVY